MEQHPEKPVARFQKVSLCAYGFSPQLLGRSSKRASEPSVANRPSRLQAGASRGRANPSSRLAKSNSPYATFQICLVTTGPPASALPLVYVVLPLLRSFPTSVPTPIRSFAPLRCFVKAMLWPSGKRTLWQRVWKAGAPAPRTFCCPIRVSAALTAAGWGAVAVRTLLCSAFSAYHTASIEKSRISYGAQACRIPP